MLGSYGNAPDDVKQNSMWMGQNRGAGRQPPMYHNYLQGQINSGAFTPKKTTIGLMQRSGLTPYMPPPSSPLWANQLQAAGGGVHMTGQGSGGHQPAPPMPTNPWMNNPWMPGGNPRTGKGMGWNTPPGGMVGMASMGGLAT